MDHNLHGGIDLLFLTSSLIVIYMYLNLSVPLFLAGIFLHVLADTLGSVGVVISTLLIKYKGWLITDPVIFPYVYTTMSFETEQFFSILQACSIFISLLIIATVVPLLQNSAEVILQRVPRSAESIIKSILAKVKTAKFSFIIFSDSHRWNVQVDTIEGVQGYRTPHFWSFTPKMLVGSLHVLVDKFVDKQKVKREVLELFLSVGLTQITIQV